MPNSVADHYPELMHYTTGDGLKGIVDSGCLRATHINFLNDSEEFRHFFKERLPNLFTDEVERYGRETNRKPNNLQESSRSYAEGLQKMTLETYDSYIVCFSAASDRRISTHGLLSQWRGYGTDGGYAIVFDTGNLQNMIANELKKFEVQKLEFPIFMHEVMYSEDHPAYPEWAIKISSYLAQTVRDIAQNTWSPSKQDHPEIFEAIITLATCHKHWGFEEEREVRLVRIWPNRELHAKEFPEIPPVQPPKTDVRGGVPVPYLELFADRPRASRHLPIKRVIVGPHRDQTLRIDAVQRLLAANGYVDVAVHGSAIPYLGR